MKLKDYVVTRPIRGIQILIVKAKTGADAKKMADENDRQVKALDAEITWQG